MTNTEFIEICYQRILGRAADEPARAHLLAAITSGHTTRDAFVVNLLQSPEFESHQASRKAILHNTFTDTEFIELCYHKILGRTADEPARTHLLAALDSGHTTRDAFVVNLLQSPEFESHQASREAFPAGHYFSALPSDEDRARYSRDIARESIPGITLRIEEQTLIYHEFAAYFADCPLAVVPAGDRRYYGSNPAFPFADAFVLHSFIRHHRPKRIIEIGSGFSSAAILDTLDFLGDSNTCCWFVEPYPQLLRSLLREQDKRHTILPCRVQDTDIAIFDALEPGDILFIDSTHVSKLDSDVNYEIFEILPRLKPGVIVHFHDIFWPFTYPEEWVCEGRAWTEAYLVRAFLQFNNAFRILYFSSYLHPKVRLTASEPFCVNFGPNDGGSLWIERT